MAEPTETWVDRIIREMDALVRGLRQRPILIVSALLVLLVYGIYRACQEYAGLSQWLNAHCESVRPGTVGWIYVGTRIDDHWNKSAADGPEPELTLKLTALPVSGSTYDTSYALNLRDALPMQQAAGTRPDMPASLGVLQENSKVKVDKVSQISITDSEKRVWIWAHVTVVEARHNDSLLLRLWSCLN
ncbi:hypothetical protein DK254_31005 [Pseudomonas sp. RW407]|uniref:hypothetical protein n=1 Tax=Pseudomonas sp. RW407 TaxID=2202894 RepID=UPI000D6FF236|nr:hypothetical protein [Pseudomonas sp. RW407]PWU26956.1 hypothetical protein DK254_31005 [Pseudomonas sp. RW407]